MEVVGLMSLRPGQLWRIARFTHIRTFLYLYLRNLTSKTSLVLVRRGDELVHVSWVVPGTRSGRYRFIPNDAYMIGPCVTAASARGCGIYPWVLGQIANGSSMPPGGFWIFCRQSNTASIRGIEKTQAEKLGSFVVVKTWWGLRKSVHYTITKGSKHPDNQATAFFTTG